MNYLGWKFVRHAQVPSKAIVKIRKTNTAADSTGIITAPTGRRRQYQSFPPETSLEILMELLTNLIPGGCAAPLVCKAQEGSRRTSGEVNLWCQLARRCRAADRQIDLQLGLCCTYVCVSMRKKITLSPSVRPPPRPPPGISGAHVPVGVSDAFLLLLLLTVPSWEHSGP